ncbi:hypothetical protein [Nostoc sp.]|uniref:hypothetical protein n=1 Tax=Nostoc sp. TaxID=1180 RepID=UPI002FFD0698
MYTLWVEVTEEYVLAGLFAIALHIYIHISKFLSIYLWRCLHSVEISSLAIDDNALLLLSSD